MAGPRVAGLAWLVEEFSSHLASVFETMAGERPSIGHAPATDQPTADLLWRQPFAGIPGTVWISATEAGWTFVAEQVARASGMADADRETLESTYLETLGQTLGGLAQSISTRVGHEVTPAGGDKTATRADESGWVALELKFSAGSAAVYVSPDAAFLAGLDVPPEYEAQEADSTDNAASQETAASLAKASGSKTFALLLDVELPISVSFGRAKVPLKDVLKLTTGSIVELNRSITDPVEVIVNNCVIARGEVVVVEGNFGVRIQQVVSRQERLRTLN